MPDLDTRLTRCFRAVFPALTDEAIPRAQRDGVAAWDSLASVMLVRVIEEEFGVTIDFLDLEDLQGFQAMRQYLLAHAA